MKARRKEKGREIEKMIKRRKREPVYTPANRCLTIIIIINIEFDFNVCRS